MFGLIDALFGFLAPRRRREPIGDYHRADDREIEPIQLLYAAWARRHHLERTDARGHVFAGIVAGREITFTTGLAGSAPLSPELLVDVDIPVDRPRLVRRGGDDPIAKPLLESSKKVRAVGLTKHLVRLTFEKLTDPAELDRALDALDETVRNLVPAEPYRG